MDFQKLEQQAEEVRGLYEKLEIKKHGRAWTTTELGLGFVGDVGDLMKLLQAQEGVRDIADWEAKLGHELADCLWSIMILAKRSGIDLEKEFVANMDQLRGQILSQLTNDIL